MAVRIFPNPTSGKMTISLPATLSGDTEVCVMNPAGQRVLLTRMNGIRGEIDLSGQAPGLYSVRVSNEAGTFMEKITLR